MFPQLYYVWTCITPTTYLKYVLFVSYSWFVFTGKIYVAGGFNNTGFLDSVEVYDPETNQWTYISPHA
jgi:hypothetical protein